jgi:hypothetical protein
MTNDRQSKMARFLTLLGTMIALMIVAVSLGGSRTPLSAQNTPPAVDNALPIQVIPDLPSDIAGSAQGASLQAAALFAWQEFIALNWPAKVGLRDTPDKSQKFGAHTSGPLVWHTYRAKNEIFPGGNSAATPPHGYTPNGTPDFGYDDPPKYVYNPSSVGSNDGEVSPCNGQAPVAQPAWINLDEATQIALDSMFAGNVPAAPTPVNSRPQLIRFMAKANRIEYRYVAANLYWYLTAGSPRKIATNNFVKAVRTGTFPAPQPYVSFPTGTIETKAAFRPLTPEEVTSNRFYTTRVRYYEQEGGKPCYREETWGLIALHIIQKTPTAPAFIFATFEQADNLLTTVNGKTVPVEDVNGNVINPSATPTLPDLTYQDSTPRPPNAPTPPPLVGENPPNAPFCNTAGQPHLFYQDTAGLTGLPTGGSICLNQRDHAIPPPVIAANRAAHQAIAEYSAVNGIGNSPWAYYKLVNVQAYPFDATEIVSDQNSPHNAATFFQANIVVETNYTLQNFNGGPPPNGAPTKYNPVNSAPYQNTFVLNPNGSLNKAYNMGGCMGCHGVAQFVQGGDFSFILGQLPSRFPETPADSNSALLKARYRLTLPKVSEK